MPGMLMRMDLTGNSGDEHLPSVVEPGSFLPVSTPLGQLCLDSYSDQFKYTLKLAIFLVIDLYDTVINQSLGIGETRNYMYNLNPLFLSILGGKRSYLKIFTKVIHCYSIKSIYANAAIHCLLGK